jgi:hypothetical protein
MMGIFLINNKFGRLEGIESQLVLSPGKVFLNVRIRKCLSSLTNKTAPHPFKIVLSFNTILCNLSQDRKCVKNERPICFKSAGVEQKRKQEF